MNTTMKLAGAFLILITILKGLDVLSIQNELTADGAVLGGALAIHHIGEVIAPVVRRAGRCIAIRRRLARWRKLQKASDPAHS